MNSLNYDELRLGLFQMDIRWCDVQGNLRQVETVLPRIKDKCDLLILPETFTTGFSTSEVSCAEPTDGIVFNTIKQWTLKYDIAICGSIIAKEDGKIFNRGFFISPNSCYFYDKRHLFRIGGEAHLFTAGNSHLIVNYKGWNISFQICYDLRFPVWSRNVNNAYDLLLYVANWPNSRQAVWETLLKARAIENISYVAGVNRIGMDEQTTYYSGGSQVIDMKGNPLDNTVDESGQILCFTISKSKLVQFRDKFPAWKDADLFKII